jgi:hypothetical protein
MLFFISNPSILLTYGPVDCMGVTAPPLSKVPFLDLQATVFSGRIALKTGILQNAKKGGCFDVVLMPGVRPARQVASPKTTSP